jgi:hypothetical protein
MHQISVGSHPPIMYPLDPRRATPPLPVSTMHERQPTMHVSRYRISICTRFQVSYIHIVYCYSVLAYGTMYNAHGIATAADHCAVIFCNRVLPVIPYSRVVPILYSRVVPIPYSRVVPVPPYPPCPPGFANHSSGFWSNADQKPAQEKGVSVAACGAQCAAKKGCVGFEVYDPMQVTEPFVRGGSSCYTFTNELKQPFTNDMRGLIRTCVKQ